MTARTPLAAAVEYAGALPVPLGHARPISPAPRPEAADVPVAELEARAEASATRWRAFFAPTDTQPEPTPEEGQS